MNHSVMICDTPKPEDEEEAPTNEDCCNSGCTPCVFDIYQERLESKKKKKTTMGTVHWRHDLLSDTKFKPFVLLKKCDFGECYCRLTFQPKMPSADGQDLVGAIKEKKIDGYLPYNPGQHLTLKSWKIFREQQTTTTVPSSEDTCGGTSMETDSKNIGIQSLDAGESSKEVVNIGIQSLDAGESSKEVVNIGIRSLDARKTSKEVVSPRILSDQPNTQVPQTTIQVQSSEDSCGGTSMETDTGKMIQNMDTREQQTTIQVPSNKDSCCSSPIETDSKNMGIQRLDAGKSSKEVLSPNIPSDQPSAADECLHQDACCSISMRTGVIRNQEQKGNGKKVAQSDSNHHSCDHYTTKTSDVGLGNTEIGSGDHVWTENVPKTVKTSTRYEEYSRDKRFYNMEIGPGELIWMGNVSITGEESNRNTVSLRDARLGIREDTEGDDPSPGVESTRNRGFSKDAKLANTGETQRDVSSLGDVKQKFVQDPHSTSESDQNIILQPQTISKGVIMGNVKSDFITTDYTPISKDVIMGIVKPDFITRDYTPISKDAIMGNVKPDFITRDYTPITLALTQSNCCFEIIVKYYSDGEMSQYLKSLTVGNTVHLRGPYGEFQYQKKHKYILALCMGTGIAPIYAIVKAILDDENDETLIKVLYGCKHVEGIILREELKEMTGFWNLSVEYYLTSSENFETKFGEHFHVKRIQKTCVYEKLKQNQLVLICGSETFNEDMVDCLLEFNSWKVDYYVF